MYIRIIWAQVFSFFYTTYGRQMAGGWPVDGRRTPAVPTSLPRLKTYTTRSLRMYRSTSEKEHPSHVKVIGHMKNLQRNLYAVREAADQENHATRA